MDFSRKTITALIRRRNFPILLLTAVLFSVGVFTFQDYGMTFDERLYYGYADAIGYAYSIPEHLSADFNIRNAYGPSADDHKNRGPAYLLLARNGVYALQKISGVDKISAWRLVNFFAFLIGVYFLYQLALRWLGRWGALSATLLYATQPLLWGHGFINPKDPPFTTIFIVTLFYGFRMVDQLAITDAGWPSRTKRLLVPVIGVGVLIGLATNLRIIGPFIGALLFGYALLKRKTKILLWFIPLAIVALVTLYVTWPYLWDAPITRFVEVLTLMSHNPTRLKVLFFGNAYRAYELPLRYLPWLLGITLTEPVWPLFFSGLIVALIRLLKKKLEWQTLGIVLFWFGFMLAYVLIMRPPMYDGYRHFLFILPPVFILCGFAFDALFKRLKNNAFRVLLLAAVISPAILAINQLHPYEYAYYNSFVGGTGGASKTYETDYWLTCYKDAVETFNDIAAPGATLIVKREPENAAYYARDDITVNEFQALKSGDFLLLSARLNDLYRTEKNAPTIITIQRDGAPFCVIKQVK